jgi:hypothetical protein
VAGFCHYARVCCLMHHAERIHHHHSPSEMRLSLYCKKPILCFGGNLLIDCICNCYWVR